MIGKACLLCHERRDLPVAAGAATRGAAGGTAAAVCEDALPSCKAWAAKGECQQNPVYLLVNCKLSCSVCSAENPADLAFQPASPSDGVLGELPLAGGAPVAAPVVTPEVLKKHPVPAPCDYAYIDIGTNAGGSLDKFVNPASYTGLRARTGLPSKWAPQVQEITESLDASSRKKWCVFSFEGNKFFLTATEATERKLRKLVRHVKLFNEVVVGGASEMTRFYLDMYNSDTASPWWGSSLFQKNLALFLKSEEGKSYADANDPREVTKQVVANLPGVTLEAILTQYVPLGAAVVIRIDAEGSEYAILEQAILHTFSPCVAHNPHFALYACVYNAHPWLSFSLL